MKVFWKIRLSDGRYGYQVMGGDLNDPILIDENCAPLEGSFDYAYVDVAEAPACYVD